MLQAHKGTGEIGAQLRAEAANPKTDIWWGGTGDPFLQAAEQGLLEPYRPAYINDLYDWSVRQYAMSGNMVGGFYTSAMGFGFNTEVLKKKKLPEPRCWADLIKPEYKGEVEMSHPATSGTGYTIVAGLVQLMGEDAAFDYLKKLHRNTIAYTRSGQAQAPNVAKGEVAIGVSFIFGFDKWRFDKYPVKAVAPCEGTGYEIGGIALVKGARNKANAHSLLRLAHEPGRPVDRRQGGQPAVAGQQDLQARSAHPVDGRCPAHQVRLREVRPGGRAQAADRPLDARGRVAAEMSAAVRKSLQPPTPSHARPCDLPRWPPPGASCKVPCSPTAMSFSL